MEIVKLLKDACEKVKKVKGINISFSSLEFYGVRKYSHENIYKLTLIKDGKSFTTYQEEWSFISWASVPWSGLYEFKPLDFDKWSEDEKLFLAWCWAIYKYCKHIEDYQNITPPQIKE